MILYIYLIGCLAMLITFLWIHKWNMRSFLDGLPIALLAVVFSWVSVAVTIISWIMSSMEDDT